MGLWEQSQEMRHHPVEMVFREYLVCMSVVWPLSHKAGVEVLSLVWTPGSYVLILVNCSIQYKHCCNLSPRLHDPTFGSGLQVWVPSSCFMSTHRKAAHTWCGGGLRNGLWMPKSCSLEYVFFVWRMSWFIYVQVRAKKPTKVRKSNVV